MGYFWGYIVPDLQSPFHDLRGQDQVDHYNPKDAV